ncbi:MAG: HAD-IIA family hydrolase [Actinomycetota bacterium]|jgi:NagD protein|nr:HAD-IIA family hydrolase [Actinomycetota bacterium]
MRDLADVRSWLCDMDGVLIKDGAMIAGADEFLDRLRATGREYLILTNNSLFTPRQLSEDLSTMGLDVPADRMWTSALALAQFVSSQRPGGSAFVIGRESIHDALANVGYREDANRPDYVVLGETMEYSYDDFATAIRLVAAGSHFVSTNPEPNGPSIEGSLPGCGAMSAVIESATGVTPYIVGKPNSVMIREAMSVIEAATDSTVMVGDRMETDILAGVDAGVRTLLVLSGANIVADAQRYPYQPSRVATSVAELIEEL